MATILGVFNDPLDARRAMDELRGSPLHLEDVSIVSRSTQSGAPVSNVDDVSAGEGAAIGAVWGGLVGLAALLIPGVGPFIAGGALFAALTGAATGAVVGGIAAALINFSGVPEEEARRYETMVHEGKTLIAVKARQEDAQDVRRILANAGADSLREDQTGLSGGPVHVAMYDESGNRVDQELEYGRTTTASTEGTRSAVGTPSMAPPSSSQTNVTGTVPGSTAADISYGMPGIYDVPTTTSQGMPTGTRQADDLTGGGTDPYATREIPPVNENLPTPDESDDTRERRM